VCTSHVPASGRRPSKHGGSGRERRIFPPQLLVPPRKHRPESSRRFVPSAHTNAQPAWLRVMMVSFPRDHSPDMKHHSIRAPVWDRSRHSSRLRMPSKAALGPPLSIRRDTAGHRGNIPLRGRSHTRRMVPV
jgi:hypothetical protein